MGRDASQHSRQPAGLALLCLLVLSLAATPLQAQQGQPAAARVQFAVGDVSARSVDGGCSERDSR